ncbi:hypothetical protein TB147_17600 [Klebsiella aerogenes]|uniref:hypothetical protein n=1 Tax=Klebsiella aerogenes TaxID=548 RepID=UPI002E34539F|nr:hypothetical protein [Klebsiella aerogenes]MED7793120.1 hypothetical protein [Klebsiella aerogenes]
MKVNISLEDMFGDSVREMRERDKEFLPKTEWFSRIETDLDSFMQTYMTKYPFTSFEAIPRDTSGLTYPAFEDLQFYLPKPLCYEPTRIVEVDGLAFVGVLGDEAFRIDPRRWHRIKTYIAKGTVEYPEVSINHFGVSNGRHRALLLMQLYNRRIIPAVLKESHYEAFMAQSKGSNAI